MRKPVDSVRQRIEKNQTQAERCFGIVFSVLISLVLLVNLVYNGGQALVDSFKPEQEAVVGTENTAVQTKTTAADKFDQSLFCHGWGVDALSALQSLRGGDFIFQDGSRDIYRDEDGRLTYLCRYRNVQNQALSLAAFSDQLKQKGTPLLYVQLPFKILRGDNDLRYRVDDYSNANADRFLMALTQKEVDTFDLRDVLTETDRAINPVFFNTDSRWQINTSFNAYLSVLSLTDQRYHLCRDTASKFGSAENFAAIRTDACFLGNQGALLGKSLVPSLDGFDTIEPYARTSFVVETTHSSGRVSRRSGDFSSAVLLRQTDATQLFNSYLGAPAPLITITNKNVTTGERVLILGDDFVNPFAAFFSLNVSSTTVVNPSLYSGSIQALADSIQPDLVLVLYNPKSFETDSFFALR